MLDTKAFQPLATQEVTMFPHRPWQHFSFPGALITRVTTVTIVTAVRGMEGVGGSSNPEGQRCGPLMFKLWDNETNLRIALSHKHFYYQTASIKQFIYIYIYTVYIHPQTHTHTHMAMWNAHVGWLAGNSVTCLFLHSHVPIKAAHFSMIDFLFVYFGLKGVSVLQTN